MKQESFSDMEYRSRKKKTKREEFLEIMDEIIPWEEWVSLVVPHYPTGKRGRPPIEIETMLALHTKMPLVSLLHRVHFRIPFFLRVFCRAGRADQRGVYDAAAPHHPSSPFQAAVDCVKKQLADALLLQQMPKVQQGRGVRNILLEKVDPHKFAHGTAVINCVLYSFIG